VCIIQQLHAATASFTLSLSNLEKLLIKKNYFFSVLLFKCCDNQQANDSDFINAEIKAVCTYSLMPLLSIFSLFFDNFKGHNQALYFAVLKKTKYFQIQKIEK